MPAAEDPRGAPEDDGQLQLLLDPDHEHRHRVEAAGRETEGCTRGKQRLRELCEFIREKIFLGTLEFNSIGKTHGALTLAREV